MLCSLACTDGKAAELWDPIPVEIPCPEAISDDSRRDFEALFAGLQQFQRRPEVQRMSDPDSYVQHITFDRIVERGEEFLPLIVQSVADGHHEMIIALRKVTGVKITDYYPEALAVEHEGFFHYSDTFYANLWLHWWQEHQAEWCEAAAATDGSAVK